MYQFVAEGSIFNNSLEFQEWQGKKYRMETSTRVNIEPSVVLVGTLKTVVVYSQRFPYVYRKSDSRRLLRTQAWNDQEKYTAFKVVIFVNCLVVRKIKRNALEGKVADPKI